VKNQTDGKSKGIERRTIKTKNVTGGGRKPQKKAAGLSREEAPGHKWGCREEMPKRKKKRTRAARRTRRDRRRRVIQSREERRQNGEELEFFKLSFKKKPIAGKKEIGSDQKRRTRMSTASKEGLEAV